MSRLSVGRLRTRGAQLPDVQWQQTNCLSCGSPKQKLLIEAGDNASGLEGPNFRVVECCDCRLVFTNPRPSPTSIHAFYGESYGPHQRVGLSPSKARRAIRWAATPAFWRLRNPERRGLPLRGGGRLLDVGCGAGRFLQLCQLQGWDVTGLDVSAAVAKRVRTELGLKVLEGTLPHPELGEQSFDCVSLWQSLEHMHQPRQTLEEVRRLLARGGMVLVAVPCIDSTAFRWFGTCWQALDLPRHLVHFTPATLQRMMEAAGLRVTSVRRTRHSGWLRHSAALAQRSGRATWPIRLLRTKWGSGIVSHAIQLAGRSDCLIAIGERS